ncbi:MAG TPA: class I SAM-dependent methyltransferase [Pirellulaceae bacterium]|nr:class I SAM-dependent methyltransferase [Pirellulaceae bacterium]
MATCYFAATGAEVTTVDLPESAFNLPSVDDTLAACGLAAEVVRKPSREAMAEWAAVGRQFDLVYVDGSHTLGDALTDLLLADLLLVPGGWLLVDDIDNADFPGVRTAWEHFLRLRGYDRDDRPNWGVGRRPT